MKFISEFGALLRDGISILDVRAPVEFAEAALPNSVNLPILNNEERASVGTVYKEAGSAAAIELGHRLVSGAVKKERVEAWKNFLRENPRAVITCFRGGMRSELAQAWLAEAGIERPRIAGGYKAVRQFLLSRLEGEFSLLTISGATGSAKTKFLRNSSFPYLDLENLAKHRGSAFGAESEPQPAQATFENSLGLEILRLAGRPGPWLVEDESRMIGSLCVPDPFFSRLREAPVVLIEETLAARIENIYAEYILQTPLGKPGPSAEAVEQLGRYAESVRKISKKLGDLRAREILADMHGASRPEEHRIWIEKLLRDYYDPLYANSLARRQPRIVFRGDHAAARDYLKKSGLQD